MSASVHTIWCPPGWSAEQTWEYISRGRKVPIWASEQSGWWVNIWVENGRLMGLAA